MNLGLFSYRAATWLLAPLVPLLLKSRVSKGKEAAAHLHARFARNLVERPKGPLIWMHSASIGESKLLLLLADALAKTRPDLNVLHTSQTLTSAEQIRLAIQAKSNRIYYPAPIDTPAIAHRFAEAWKPDLAIFAEGEIWPNLLREVRKGGTKTALINARMTEKSLRGWARWPNSAKTIFGGFDLIAASDTKTAKALQSYAPHAFALPANLKSDLPPPPADREELAELSSKTGNRLILLAASTHPDEETLVLDALTKISPKPFLILVPRHPERSDEIEQLCLSFGYTVSRRSTRAAVTEGTDILLGDTIGDMGLWLRLCDTVYLGGGHKEGVGGHNPLEAIQLGKPVVTGPNVFNFTAMMKTLQQQGALTFVDTAADLAKAFPASLPENITLYDRSPLLAVLDHLSPLLPPQRSSDA